MTWLSPTLMIILIAAAPVQAKVCKTAQRNACNTLLLLDDADKAQAEHTHLPYGIPTAPLDATNERLLHQAEYIINYDADLLVPTWVGYRLRDTDIQDRERLDCFRPDPRLLPSDSAELNDHKEDNQTRPNTFVESMTFILPHKDETRPFNERNEVLKAHLDKIETVEALTGLTFLLSLTAENPAKAQAVRHFKAQAMWSEPEKQAELLDSICTGWANE